MAERRRLVIARERGRGCVDLELVRAEVVGHVVIDLARWLEHERS